MNDKYSKLDKFFYNENEVYTGNNIDDDCDKQNSNEKNLSKNVKEPSEINKNDNLPSVNNLGILSKYKIKYAEDRAHFKKAQEKINAELTFYKEQLSVTHDLKRKELQLAYETSSERMKMAYTNLLQDLGLEQNENIYQAIKKLQQQTNRQMFEVSEMDIHPKLAENCMKAITKMNEDMFNRIMGELGDRVEDMGKGK